MPPYKPYASKAQQRMFFGMARRGKISWEEARGRADATNQKKLPERVKESSMSITSQMIKAAAAEKTNETLDELSKHASSIGLGAGIGGVLGGLAGSAAGGYMSGDASADNTRYIVEQALLSGVQNVSQDIVQLPPIEQMKLLLNGQAGLRKRIQAEQDHYDRNIAPNDERQGRRGAGIGALSGGIGALLGAGVGAGTGAIVDAVRKRKSKPKTLSKVSYDSRSEHKSYSLFRPYMPAEMLAEAGKMPISETPLPSVVGTALGAGAGVFMGMRRRDNHTYERMGLGALLGGGAGLAGGHVIGKLIDAYRAAQLKNKPKSKIGDNA